MPQHPRSLPAPRVADPKRTGGHYSNGGPDSPEAPPKLRRAKGSVPWSRSIHTRSGDVGCRCGSRSAQRHKPGRVREPKHGPDANPKARAARARVDRQPFLLEAHCGSSRGRFAVQRVALALLPRGGVARLVRSKMRLLTIGVCADALRAQGGVHGQEACWCGGCDLWTSIVRRRAGGHRGPTE